MSVEQPKTTPETWKDTSWEATIKATKEQLAEAYLNFLDQQKWGLLATGAWMGVNLNPLQKDAMEYLTTEKSISEKKDILSIIGKNIKKKFVEKMTGWTMLAYDKASLAKMKALIIENKDNQWRLQELMDQIASGVDPTLVALPTVAAAPMTAPADTTNKPKVRVEYDDKTNREKVVTSLGKVIEEDKKNPIEYKRWGRTDPEKWLDCSGLIYYTLAQAGLKIGETSRDMFQTLDTKKLELKPDSHEMTTDVSDIREGDIVFWNSTNPDYHRSTWPIPTIEKDGTEYRIHHVAFIKKIDPDTGMVTVVESNGAQGVTESEIDVAKVLTDTKHKSELYVAHVNYDDLEKKQSTTAAIA